MTRPALVGWILRCSSLQKCAGNGEEQGDLHPDPGSAKGGDHGAEGASGEPDGHKADRGCFHGDHQDHQADPDNRIDHENNLLS